MCPNSRIRLIFSSSRTLMYSTEFILLLHLINAPTPALLMKTQNSLGCNAPLYDATRVFYRHNSFQFELHPKINNFSTGLLIATFFPCTTVVDAFASKATKLFFSWCSPIEPTFAYYNPRRCQTNLHIFWAKLGSIKLKIFC